MDHRLLVGTLLFFGASLAAQIPVQTAPPAAQPANPPAAQPAKPAAATPAAQDPDKPVQTPAQKFEQLTMERQRLEREITYVHARAKDAKSILSDKLAQRAPTFRSIDAGTSAPKFAPTPPAAQPRIARVGTKEEMAGHSPNTMVLVNGRPIDQSAFDAVMQYLGEAAGKTTEEARAQRALFELIRVEAVASAYEDHEGEDKLSEAMTDLDKGKSMADLAKTYGVVHGCGPDGQFEVTRNSIFGSIFEQVAFKTEAGHKARPFRGAGGYVLLQVDKFEKGATPELDKVIGQAAQVPYSADAELAQKAQMAVTTGQVDILARDEAVLKMLPPMFTRSAMPMPGKMIPGSIAPAEHTEGTVDMKELEVLQQQINELSGKTDDASKAQRQELEQKYGALKRRLREARMKEQAQQPRDTVTPAPVTPPNGGGKKG